MNFGTISVSGAIVVHETRLKCIIVLYICYAFILELSNPGLIQLWQTSELT